MGFFTKLKRVAEAAIKIFTSNEEIETPVSSETAYVEEREREYRAREEERQNRLERMREEGRDVINEANRLYDELIRQDLGDYSPPFQEAESTGGRFDVEDLDSEVAINREILRATNFLHDEASDVEVASYLKRQALGEQITEDIKERYDLDLYTTRIHEDNAVKSFWEVMDRVREIKEISGDLARLSYAKDAAYSVAFARWEEVMNDSEEAQFDAVKKAIENFIYEADRVASRSVTPQSGVASFKREGDSFRRKGDW